MSELSLVKMGWAIWDKQSTYMSTEMLQLRNLREGMYYKKTEHQENRATQTVYQGSLKQRGKVQYLLRSPLLSVLSLFWIPRLIVL